MRTLNAKEWKSVPENRINLMNYRLETAQEKLEIAKLLLDAGLDYQQAAISSVALCHL